MKAYRASFWFSDILTTEGASARINMAFDDDAETTGISLTPTLSEGEGAWYDLQGRKLDKQPNAKGVYIHNGKKEVIK